jgi:hypothetical protein
MMTLALHNILIARIAADAGFLEPVKGAMVILGKIALRARLTGPRR